MPRKSERQKAREVVAAYHETALGELVAHVATAIDGFRNGDLDAFEVDRALFQYSRGAKEGSSATRQTSSGQPTC